MQKELTISELDLQHAELLPERETLLLNFGSANVANVLASNAAAAVNIATIQSAAIATAAQSINVVKFGAATVTAGPRGGPPRIARGR
jgi:hypothetical protein